MENNGKRSYRKMFIILPGKKEQNGPGAVNMKILMRSGHITVRPVAIPCLKVTPNLKAVVAGQVFMNLSVKAALFIRRIIHSV